MKIDVTVDNYEEFLKSEKAVLDIWAPWCGPCRMFVPVFEQVAEETDGITFGKLNSDEQGELAQRLGVRSLPTILFFKDGEIVHTKIGAAPANEFKQLLEDYLG